MPSYLQRKYIDLIREISSKWVNWDPPIEVHVGAYGTVDRQTGDLRVEGNIYDPEFQQELDKQRINLNLADYPPQEAAAEDDFIVSSGGAKRRDLNADHEADIPGIANASLKAQWCFERGKRDAVLIVHKPRLFFIPSRVVLEHLYRVDKLVDKWLVTNVQKCPAYSMYLSDKLGEKVTFALVAQAPIAGVAGITAGASTGFNWVVDAQTGLLRKACQEKGEYVFTPLYSLKRPIKRQGFGRFFRDDEPEPSGDDLWISDYPPWDPLDEDGEEDLIEVENRQTENRQTDQVV